MEGWKEWKDGEKEKKEIMEEVEKWKMKPKGEFGSFLLLDIPLERDEDGFNKLQLNTWLCCGIEWVVML